ncbi:probable nucleoredoxin 2 isoform X3 [Durio zibethinus]|uniref:protein-disulfide reductase n=1 Tax=Durio zibethinus TaxID=66656 RepID=A0A6P5ZK99_DURZI|nr:probable nucleoredoxin 2 isoform X3 [Durio zibethinus]
MEASDVATCNAMNMCTSREEIVLQNLQAMVPVDSLIGKTVGLYFSEERCFPCVKFTPKLISVYQRIKQMLEEKGGEDFEIVFVSNDRDQSSFDSYFATMPWLALPFGDPTVKSLAKYFDVQGNPCLIIIGPDGKTITKQGHCHELTLVSEGTGGGPFICCDCDEQGSGWAYLCLECGYEVHPRCMRPVAPAGSIEGSKENVYWKLGRDVGIFSSPFFGHFNITFVSSLLN